MDFTRDGHRRLGTLAELDISLFNGIGWIFLWLIGIPVPLLIIFFLLRGCT